MLFLAAMQDLPLQHLLILNESLLILYKNDQQLQQDGSNKFKRHGYQTGVGFDWTLKERNNFSGSLNYNNFGNKGNGFMDQSQIIIQCRSCRYSYLDQFNQ